MSRDGRSAEKRVPFSFPGGVLSFGDTARGAGNSGCRELFFIRWIALALVLGFAQSPTIVHFFPNSQVLAATAVRAQRSHLPTSWAAENVVT